MGVEKNRIMSQGYELLGELSAYKSVHKESFHCKKITKIQQYFTIGVQCSGEQEASLPWIQRLQLYGPLITLESQTIPCQQVHRQEYCVLHTVQVGALTA